MATIDQLTTSIIDDLAKDGEEGVTAAASNAIGLAILHYETLPWWFLETINTEVTANGTEYYDVPSDFGTTEVTISITVSNNTYPLIKRNFQTIEDWFVKSSVFTGYSTDYAIYQQQFRLFPVPNGAYPLTIAYYKALGAPSSGNSNAWTTDAELLIRSRAEWQMNSLRYHDLEAATVAKQMETVAFGELDRKNRLRMTSGSLRKRRV